MLIVGQGLGLDTIETRTKTVLLSGKYLQAGKYLYIISIIIEWLLKILVIIFFLISCRLSLLI